MPDTDGMFVNDFLILPGQWRPQCPWEHIAWISPPWPSQYYLWLDLPETVFCDAGNLFLSHINMEYPPIFPNLPKIPWRVTPTGLACARSLPNGVEFAVRVDKLTGMSVGLAFEIFNGSDVPLRNLRTQTCSYLRNLKEFSECTRSNKYVCEAGGRWTRLEDCRVSLDYRDGKLALPVIATRSSETHRLVAMTWYENTGKLWSNPIHPCMHADPRFDEIVPGSRATVRGAILFFEGSLEEFSEWFTRNGKEGSRQQSDP